MLPVLKGNFKKDKTTHLVKEVILCQKLKKVNHVQDVVAPIPIE
jgi:hypothetical protein